MNNLPKDQALALCEQLRAENRGKWYTYQTWWCWGCTTFTKGDPAKRCFANAAGNRGCLQVNERFDRAYPGTGTKG